MLEIVKNCIRISAIGQLYPEYLSEEVKSGQYDWIINRPSDGIKLTPSIINKLLGDCFKNIAKEDNGKQIIDDINQFMIEAGEVDNLKRTPEKVSLDLLDINRICCRTVMLGTSEIALQD